MAPIGSVLAPKPSIFFLMPVKFSGNFGTNNRPVCKFYVSASSSSSSVVTEPKVGSATKKVSLGFKDLSETFLVDVHRAEGRPLSLELNAPLSFGSVSVEKVENVVIRVELANGCVGWGEVSLLPSNTATNHTTALTKAMEISHFLHWISPKPLNVVLNEIGLILPGHEFASVRAGFETALIDAVANSIDVPLWRLFGGLSNTISTAITIPSVSPAETFELASNYYQLGFKTLNLSIGKNIDADIKTMKAIKAAHPLCSLIIDAHGQYTSKEAIEVLQKFHDSRIRPVLFMQPVHGDDWTGLGKVTALARKNYEIAVAADESCKTMADVQRVIRENHADVINVKLAKFGVMGALEVIGMAKNAGKRLMISSTVESRIATGFAGHLAAGIQSFEFVCLDKSFHLSKDPVVGGYKASNSNYKFLNARGQGGFLTWDMTSQ